MAHLRDVSVSGARRASKAGGPQLLQRGNGEAGVDAVVDLDAERLVRALESGQPLLPDLVRTVRRWELGRAGHVRLSFTDAAPLPDGRGLNIAHEAVDRHASGPPRPGSSTLITARCRRPCPDLLRGAPSTVVVGMS